MPEARDPAPHILLVMPDQMRGDALSYERHPVLSTPNIDAIGGAGTHFRRAYTTCPSCIPARRSLLTGQFPATNGMPGFVGGCSIKSTTLPPALRSAGYETVLCGRNMHQSPAHEPYGYERRIHGSTYVRGDQYARELERAYPGAGGVDAAGLSSNGWTARPWPFEEHWHPTNWATTRSCEVLGEPGDGRPLFLTASFYAPHPPLFPPAWHFQRYWEKDLPDAAIGPWASRPENDGLGLRIDSPRCCLEGDRLREAQAGYFGLNHQIDDQLQRLAAALQARSRRDGRPWVIVFTSDHGEMLGDHYYFRKCEPYEGSARIPMLIAGSRDLGFAPGQSLDRPVCLEDLMPTFLELAGAEPPEGIDGRSLVPTLRGETTGVRDLLHAEHAPCYSAEQAFHSLTDGRHKYVWRPLDGGEQLFDLVADPHELTPITEEAAVRPWRERLIEELADRPEGFSDGTQLFAGCEYPGLMAHA